MVLDQEEALDFYVNKLGLEVAQDIHQGPFRWLTVRAPANLASRYSSRSRVRPCRMKPPPHSSAS
jgi:catechol 2,3-dioxygenase-like lactoylglutathione lyase family enzyme